MNNTEETVFPLVRVKDKFQITIPTKVRKLIHIKRGDVLEVGIKDQVIIIKPKVVLDRTNVEDAINEGLKDYKKGNLFGPFKNIKEFKIALKK